MMILVGSENNQILVCRENKVDPPLISLVQICPFGPNNHIRGSIPFQTIHDQKSDPVRVIQIVLSSL